VLERSYYSDLIGTFLGRTESEILGTLSRRSTFADQPTQKAAWVDQIRILKAVFGRHREAWSGGKVYFEFDVPRMGKRIDVVAAIGHALFVLEFKVGDTEFAPSAIDQVYDYALDLKHFHETSHRLLIAPVLIATRAQAAPLTIRSTSHDDGLLVPIRATPGTLCEVIERVLAVRKGPLIDFAEWEQGRYCPTPTIIEAALALYGGHSVESISRSDAGAINLSQTSRTISTVIRDARANNWKAICFVTGVPGAGKTLVGLNVATQHSDPASALHSVFLSGNGPLVRVLREALARDKVNRLAMAGRRGQLGAARSEVRAFIQNVHHFRDECLRNERPPVDRVVLFDEAQRAWNREQTASFMRRKRAHADFSASEPEFLISCMDRHTDWAVIVCLVGGGQEINTGEAGIGEWIASLQRSFPHWHVYISPRLQDVEYGAGLVLSELAARPNVTWSADLHLAVSMRSFRAENVSAFVKAVLDQERSQAQRLLDELNVKYPIRLTRDLNLAKQWLKQQARGTERYGLVVSSQALRLKPHAIDVRSPTDPVHWFLYPKEDVRSSYYLEDAATEFDVQGLELDWTGVVWDGDLRPLANGSGWSHHSFVGTRWNRIKKPESQTYLKNAYRVLLTRARQGMVIIIPRSDPDDPTRAADVYDPTFEYLRSIGIRQL
jgi:hypothetical protein